MKRTKCESAHKRLRLERESEMKKAISSMGKYLVLNISTPKHVESKRGHFEVSNGIQNLH